MPNGAHRRKRRRRGSGRPQRQRAGHVRTLTHVTIDWRMVPRLEWNAHTPPAGQMLDPEYALVVVGYATKGAEQLGMVYGPVCCAREVDDYIDTVLSPAINAQLDEAVGPLAWRAESTAPGRKL